MLVSSRCGLFSRKENRKIGQNSDDRKVQGSFSIKIILIVDR